MKLSLKSLILLVALLAVSLTLVSSITSGYRVNQQTLIENTLETNRVYAKKLAITTDNFMKSTIQTLETSADEIASFSQDNKEEYENNLFHETERLFNQTNTFNSVIVTSASGEVIATSPETLNIIGQQADTFGELNAIDEKVSLISKPFTSLTGRLIVFLSAPIFDSEGGYLGYVGGSIYLLEPNILNELLGDHFYQDGSYVYVTDEDGRLIYHPDQERVGEVVVGNAVIDNIMTGKNGAESIKNKAGIEMLAGYSYIPSSKWGVVSQRPVEATLASSADLRNQMILNTLPFLLLSFIVIVLLSSKITQPLQRLAYYAHESTKRDNLGDFEDVHAWYYEVIELENALLKSYTYFQNRVNYFIYESTTDPLTGLLNRRAMDNVTQKWLAEKTPFSIILFDIDRFKRVNDTYGHAVGDEVLKFLAKEMKNVSRADDVSCRYGGEEFILLLPETSLRESFEIAERLRKKLESTISPCGEAITISSGISNYPDCGSHLIELIETADKSLYKAKNTGRNKSIMAECIKKSPI